MVDIHNNLPIHTFIMPAVRASATSSSKKPIAPALIALEHVLNSLPSSSEFDNTKTPRDFACVDNVFYPEGRIQRESYRTKAGKRVTAHQWAVYDLVRKIPAGNISTYKDVCNALGAGSPRSVGSALKNNSFAPYVPCHRVITSTRFIGGFCGERASAPKSRKTKQTEGSSEGQEAVSHCDWKLEMLSLEGVEFDAKGYLVNPEKAFWKF